MEYQKTSNLLNKPSDFKFVKMEYCQGPIKCKLLCRKLNYL